MRLALPLRLDGSSFATLPMSNQHDDRELLQNVRVILGTFVGERLVVPEFGIEDPTFGRAPSLDENEIISAVRAWEDRGSIEISYEPAGTEQDIEVGVSL